MAKKKIYEKIANVDLEIHKSATSDEYERYEAALLAISCLKKILGRGVVERLVWVTHPMVG